MNLSAHNILWMTSVLPPSMVAEFQELLAAKENDAISPAQYLEMTDNFFKRVGESVGLDHEVAFADIRAGLEKELGIGPEREDRPEATGESAAGADDASV